MNLSIRMPKGNHPNRLPFRGRLTRLDTPSDRAPWGARGHRVLLTSAAARGALPSLLGMAIDCKVGWDGHDARRKVGVITGAAIADGSITVTGYIFARDFPEVGETADPEELGMSYELADCHVADMRSEVWTLKSVTFTGAAILLKRKAAYRDTSFILERKGK